MKSNDRLPPNAKTFKFLAHSQRFALESRLVFDGAMLATATEAQQDNVDDQAATDNGNFAVTPTSDRNIDFAPVTDTQATVIAANNLPEPGTLTDLFAAPADLNFSPVIEASSEQSPTLIIVDSRAANAVSLHTNPPENAQVVIIDSQRDGYQQISELLQDRHDVSSLHVIPFNDGTTQWLGNKSLNAALEPATSTALTHWGDGFAHGGELVFHGQNAASAGWLSHVSALTGTKANWSQAYSFDDAQPVVDNTSMLNTDDAASSSAEPVFIVVDASSVHTDILNAVQKTIRERISEWVNREDFLNQAAIPFSANAGSDEWVDNALDLKESINNGSYSIRLEIRSNAELNGVFGAYSAVGTGNQPTLYLNAEWLATVTPDAIKAVLLEELGHDFDHRLNGETDSPGDEGQAFAGLLLYNNANLNVVLTQDDHLAINPDGQALAIEAAAPYSVAQTFFVPMRETDIKTSLYKINTGVGNVIQTVISMVSTDAKTIVIYDHWEDGYEADIKNPLQATTQIWGDGIDANGIAPGFAHDPDGLGLGRVITLQSTVDLAKVGSLNPSGALNGTPYYDGRDKIASTKAIAVTKAGWGVTPGTVLAGSVNLYDAGNAGTSYLIPMGENVITSNPDSPTNRLFEYTSLHIIANENNTKVVIDKDGNAATTADQITVTLNQGETYLVNGGVLAGTTVTSSDALGAGAIKPIEVYAIAGDVGSSYENRWFAITPRTQWSNSYYAPVSTTLATDPTYVFLYNPNASAITVYYDTQTTTGNAIVVPANTSKYVQMPSSAAHFYTTAAVGVSPDKFYAISTIDSDATANQTHDWSYSLVPESYLTNKFVVAWGPGWNNTGGGAAPTGTLNGSPVWVTSPTATTLYIDYNGDGTVDTTYNIKALESYRISDPDKDQSGLTVYTTDGTLITAAWGEDPSVAGAGNPYLDMGTTIMPFPDYVLKKESKEASPVIYGSGVSNGNGLMQLGEQIEYTISVTNRAVIDLFGINIKDSLQIGSSTYVVNSAQLTVYNPDGTVSWSNSDLDGASTAFPLDAAAGGYTLTDTDPVTPGIQGLQRGYQAVITYRVTIQSSIDKTLTDNNFVISNTVTMSGDPAGGGDPVIKTVTNQAQQTVPFSDGEVFFYDSSFTNIATTYQQNTALGLQVTDSDQNKNTAAADTFTVKVTNTSTGETEDVLLTETGNNTGIFRNTLATSTSTGAGNNNGTLVMVNGNAIKVEYTDPASGAFADNPVKPGITPTGYDSGLANVKTALVAAVLPTPTDGLLVIDSDTGFTTVKTSYQEGDTLYLNVVDGDQNTNAAVAEIITVTVTNTTTGELETVTLTETGVNTGIFHGTLSTSNISSVNANNSGSLQMVLGDTLQADYTDGIFGANFDNPIKPGIVNPYTTGNANRVIAAVTKTKTLYLSDDGVSGDSSGDLDRIDPIGTADGTTNSTAAIDPTVAGTGGGTGTYIDNFSTAAYNNSNGTESWASNPWTEVGSGNDTNASSGLIRVNTAASSNTNGAGLAFYTTNGGTVNSPDVQRTLDLSGADTGQPINLTFVCTANSLSGGSENITLKISTDGGTTFNTITVGTVTGGSVSFASGVFSGGSSGSTTSSFSADIKSLIASATDKSNIIIRFDANALARSSFADPLFTVDTFQVAFTKTGGAGTPATPATFTQAIPMADQFDMPTGGIIKIVTYVSSESGTLNTANVKADLTYGASNTVIANLASPVYDATAHTLTWTGTLANNVHIPAGDTVKLVVTNNETGASFKIDYDSNTKQSRIELPTTTVIDIADVDANAGNGIQEIGFFNNAYANGGGSLISSGSIDAGGIVYVRVKVLDPFGDYDITGLQLAIDGPDTSGDIGVATTLTLTNAHVVDVNDNGLYKIYEYAWQTVNNTGLYNVNVVAEEGHEGITATASSSLAVTALDLGTPSTTVFITALNGVDAGATYEQPSDPAPGVVDAYLRVTDLDENTNPASAETVTAIVNGTSFTLTETGPNTGIFEAALTGTGFVDLPQGTVLTANYVDNDDATDTSVDTISVPTPANNVPTATNNAQSINENVNATGNVITGNEGSGIDSDPDTDPLTVIAVNGSNSAVGNTITLPSGATLIVVAGGAYTYNPNGVFNYLPVGQTATDSYTYTISDGKGGTSTATVTITINGVNTAPTSSVITPQIHTDGRYVDVDVDSKFADIDGTLTYSASGLPAGLSINPVTGKISGTVDKNASDQADDNNGSQSYTVTVTATDNNSATSNQIFNWTINNVAPDAVNDTGIANEDVTFNGNVLTNDSDGSPDSDALVVTQFTVDTNADSTQETFSAGQIATIAGVGTVQINSTGAYTFIPIANYNGPVPVVTYTISDGNGGTDTATLTITMDPAPDAVNDTNSAVGGGSAISANVLVNDDEGNTSGTVTTAAQGANSITLGNAFTTAAGGSLTLNSDGSYSYMPPAQGSVPVGGLSEVISYTITDANGDSSTATLTITVADNNLVPLASNDSKAATEAGSAVSDNVLTHTGSAADSLGDAPTTVTGATQGVNSITLGSAFTTAAGGSLTLNSDGSYSYTPPATLPEGGALTEVFDYTLTDADGDTNTATLTITVDRLPDAVDDTNSAVEGGSAVSANVLTNDDEGNTSGTVTTAAQGANSITLGSAFTTAAGGSLTLNSDGSYSYTPPATLPEGGALTEVFDY
ncbi:MAG: Ig-like domain-containing protein, partial [Methylovulum sp.]|nr:Ig-like domain-containing protein [Methylovulum sp.]